MLCPYCNKPLIHSTAHLARPVQFLVEGVMVADGFVCSMQPYCTGLYPGKEGERIWKQRKKIIHG